MIDPHAHTVGGLVVNADRTYDSPFSCDATVEAAYRNTTVVSHAFYLFAVGGTKNGCEIVGQGVDKMLPVFHRAWENYFPQACTFNEAYTYLLQACADLYPASVVDELRKALQAVELDQPGLCSGLPEAPPPCAVSGVADRGNGGALDEAPRLGAAWPNPMQHATRIAYTLPREGRVTVSLLDVAGRLVRRLVDETRPAGAHTLEWDARDDAGRAVPGGLYFYRLEALGRVATNRLVVTR